MIKTFNDAYQILDQAINDIDVPMMKPLVQNEVQLVKRSSQEFIDLGIGHVEDVAAIVTAQVRANPVLFIGGAAALALGLGLILSQSSAQGERA